MNVLGYECMKRIFTHMYFVLCIIFNIFSLHLEYAKHIKCKYNTSCMGTDRVAQEEKFIACNPFLVKYLSSVISMHDTQYLSLIHDTQ